MAGTGPPASWPHAALLHFQRHVSIAAPTKYEDFLALLALANARSIPLAELVMRVADLFEGHYRLLIAFNFMLPLEYKILAFPQTPAVVSGEEYMRIVEAFLMKVRLRFLHDPELFEIFRLKFERYSDGVIEDDEMLEEARCTFSVCCPDLLEEFMFFLPDV